jgi:hypothetical protein
VYVLVCSNLAGNKRGTVGLLAFTIVALIRFRLAAVKQNYIRRRTIYTRFRSTNDLECLMYSRHILCVGSDGRDEPVHCAEGRMHVGGRQSPFSA